MTDFISLLPDYLAVLLGKATIEYGLPLEAAIPREQLDFSIESLRALDVYLGQLAGAPESLPEEQVVNITLVAGAYLGEVIRRNARRSYQWLPYAEYFASRPKLAGLFPLCLGTTAVLATDSGAMTLPVNKISRFIQEGPENGTHYYASLEVKQ